MIKYSLTVRTVKMNPPSGSLARLGLSSAAARAHVTQATAPMTSDSARAEPANQMQISRLSEYLVAAISGSPTQVAKISELGAAVASGTYAVDSEAVSEGIIRHTLLWHGAW
jgi:anti-sigma28 factor (negative regulator of flagellin synthesis)